MKPIIDRDGEITRISKGEGVKPKLTAPQLRVLRLMRDGWTLYAGQGTSWMARLRKDGEPSQGLAYNTLYALLDRKLCRRVTKPGSNRDLIYRLTALGREAVEGK